MSASRRRALEIAGIVVALGLILRSAVPMAAGLDYFEDAAFPLDALARGDFHAFAQSPPLMGNLSMFLRAPFVALVFDQDIEVVYLVGAVPCVAAVIALGLVLRRLMLRLGRPAEAATLVAAVALLNPGTFRALHWGHPEELLAGALCVGAVLAALRGRGLAAGVLLGLAVATKQWALVAVVPTLLAATGGRGRLCLAAAGAALLVTLPTVVAAPGRFVQVSRQAAATSATAGASGAVVSPMSVWRPFARERSAAERRVAGPGFDAAIPAWLGRLTHPAIVLAGLPLGWLLWRRRRDRAPEDALGLLALLLLLRCLLDPWNIDYYHAPLLLSLLAWEALRGDGWPRVTLLVSAALALTFPASVVSMSQMSADWLRYSVTYLGWALPLAGWLALAVFAPQRLRAIRPGLPSGLDAGRAEVHRLAA